MLAVRRGAPRPRGCMHVACDPHTRAGAVTEQVGVLLSRGQAAVEAIAASPDASSRRDADAFAQLCLIRQMLEAAGAQQWDRVLQVRRCRGLARAATLSASLLSLIRTAPLPLAWLRSSRRSCHSCRRSARASTSPSARRASWTTPCARCARRDDARVSLAPPLCLHHAASALRWHAAPHRARSLAGAHAAGRAPPHARPCLHTPCLRRLATRESNRGLRRAAIASPAPG